MWASPLKRRQSAPNLATNPFGGRQLPGLDTGEDRTELKVAWFRDPVEERSKPGLVDREHQREVIL